jgi:LDH2 family malate/lactate/ureidoglycolate dehydrogenase
MAESEAYRLNLPPDTFVRVPHADMEAFVAKAMRRAGLNRERSELLAGLLVGNDLRGVFSHGTRLATRYARAMRSGGLNGNPAVRVVRETPASVVVDGDGGLGYFPMIEGTRLAIERARTSGVAVMMTRNHGHIGAAGIYSRMTLEHDLLTFVTGGRQTDLEAGMPVYSPAVGSPMSFSAPAGSEDPLVVDFSPVYDLRTSPHREQIARWVPGTVFRCIGLGAIAQAWGGVLAGSTFSSSTAVRRFAEADHTALLVTFQIGLFIAPAEFRREMDGFARRVAALEPLEGFERSQLAGGPEGERERQYRVAGIPVGLAHKSDLEELAADAGLDVPWAT